MVNFSGDEHARHEGQDYMEEGGIGDMPIVLQGMRVPLGQYFLGHRSTRTVPLPRVVCYP